MKGAPRRNEEREPAWLHGAGRSVCRRGGLQSCFAYAKARAMTACLYSVDAAGSIRQLSDRTSSALAHFEPFSLASARGVRSLREVTERRRRTPREPERSGGIRLVVEALGRATSRWRQPDSIASEGDVNRHETCSRHSRLRIGLQRSREEVTCTSPFGA